MPKEGAKKTLDAPVDQPVENFDAVAKWITPDPPEWLAEHLKRWSSTIFVGRQVEKLQPTRVEMKQILDKVVESAALLQRALAEASVCEFLDRGGDSAMDSPVKFQRVIEELRRRAIGATKLLVNSEGKPKAGQGPALPSNAISAQTYCALLIAETWKWFRGEYPPPRNAEAAKAVDLYWKLSGGTKLSWGNEPLNSWRHHLRKSLTVPAEKDRSAYRRHLRECERNALLQC